MGKYLVIARQKTPANPMPRFLNTAEQIGADCGGTLIGKNSSRIPVRALQMVEVKKNGKKVYKLWLCIGPYDLSCL